MTGDGKVFDLTAILASFPPAKIIFEVLGVNLLSGVAWFHLRRGARHAGALADALEDAGFGVDDGE